MSSTWYASKSLGNDAWDGTQPYFVSGTTGPKKNCRSAMALVNANGDTVALYAGDSFTDETPGSNGVLEWPAAYSNVTVTSYGGTGRPYVQCPLRSLTITSVTAGATTTLTCNSHGRAAGQWIESFSGFAARGITGLDGNAGYIVSATTNTFVVNLTSTGTWTAGTATTQHWEHQKNVVYIKGSNGASVLNLDISKGSAGVQCAASPDSVTTGVLVSGCYIHHNNQHGTGFQDTVSTGESSISFANNILSYNRNDHINAQGNTSTSKAVTAVSVGATTVLTANSHGYTVGQRIANFTGFAANGVTGLDGQAALITATTTNTFTVALSTSGVYGGSGGTAIPADGWVKTLAHDNTMDHGGYDPDGVQSYYTPAGPSSRGIGLGGGDGYTHHGKCYGDYWNSTITTGSQSAVAFVNTANTTRVWNIVASEISGSAFHQTSGGSITVFGCMCVAPVNSPLDSGTGKANFSISGSGTAIYINNTSVTARGAAATSLVSTNVHGWSFRGHTGTLTFKNNATISDGTAPFIVVSTSAQTSMVTGNNYYGIGSGGSIAALALFYQSNTASLKTFAQWQALTIGGLTLDTIGPQTGGTNIKGGSAPTATDDWMPDSGSALIGNGADLSGLSIAEWLQDANGRDRNASVGVEIGALQKRSGASYWAGARRTRWRR